MPNSTNLWRAQIGTFGIMIAKLCVMSTWSSITKAKFQNSFVLSFFFLITFLSLLLILSNDFELNPGLKKDSSKRNFPIAHWNVNSIAAQNCVKLSQLESDNAIHTYDLICLSETWLDSATSLDSNDLSLKSYNLHRVDDSDDVKKGGVCVYYKETLAVHFLQTKLDQCIVSEVTIKNKKTGHVISLYRSPSQTPDQFDNFLQLFEEVLQDIFNLKSSFVLITSDFNCRNSSWYLGDLVTLQGARVKALTSSLAWISSISSTCHHEIVFAKLNLKVEYPALNEHVFWDYSRADKTSINRAINVIDWNKVPANKTVESQVSELNDLLLNIYSNYIPDKTVLCDDKDPPWMNNGIRTAIEMKNIAYKEYIRSGMRHTHYVCLENLTTKLSNLICDTNTEYHSKLAAKLVNPSTSAKTCWSVLKNFGNDRKVPVIPPLLINNEFISNFKTKDNYFNRFFNQQCTAISTDSSIPSSLNLAINETITTVNFDEQLISNLIVALSPNKAHGHDL